LQKPKRNRKKESLIYPNIVHVKFTNITGKSKTTNVIWYERNATKKHLRLVTAQYLLIKAQPASGKSRA